ncbi:MAG: hypothetical protein FE834_08380 [Gammaproteobacteria bacterium]|uniref:Uncharacterized protein n=1 Tax=hydrothermal vent metagenome TaxID=652676 RepID=A0A1W1E5R4_9ZZZZ|nr:hypothetical protein [Gammaproteobacteria bacterium]
MIYDIDYYPKQRKKSKIKPLVAILALITIAFYFFFDDSQMIEKPQGNFIIIKEAEIDELKVTTIAVKTDNNGTPARFKKPEILENLDEIITNNETNTHNY